MWGMTLEVNVTANYLLADEAAKTLREQGLTASDCVDELGQCGCCQARQRGLRREQSGAEPSGARAGDCAGAEGACEWNQSRHGGEGIDDVSARPRDGFADEVRTAV